MPSTAVVADTTSYLPLELIAEHDVHLVSLYVGMEGDQDRESDIDDLQDFYERLRASDQTVTTSQPSVGDFIAVYEPLLAEGHEIVSIHLSSVISGTYESAMQARERLTAEGKGRGADRGLRLADGLRRDGADDPRRRQRRRAGRERIRGERTRPGTPRGAQDLVRRRHARLPAARRPDRGRTRLDRHHAEDQADPHPRGGDHPHRAGPDASAGPSSGWSTTPASATKTAPMPGSSSTSRTPRTPRAWSRPANRSSATTRSSPRRSVP